MAGGDDAVAVGVGVLATGVGAEAGAGDGVEAAPEPPGVWGGFRLESGSDGGGRRPWFSGGWG